MSCETLDSFITETELAEHLHVSLGTLRKWRKDGNGPPY
jgi:hypothetical protein